MKKTVLALCGAAALAMAPVGVSAFEIQGEGDPLPQSPAAQFQGFGQSWVQPDFNGYSLAIPYSSKGGSAHVSDYGNSIPIPAPGIDQPAPAWAYGIR